MQVRHFGDMKRVKNLVCIAYGVLFCLTAVIAHGVRRLYICMFPARSLALSVRA